MKIYGFPVLPKAGLANMLIPWAECFIWCKESGYNFIAPHWTKLRIGPYFRRERDKRQYQKLFTNGGNISGLKRFYLTLTSNFISYEEFLLNKTSQKSRSTIVCFSNMNHLERLIPFHKEIISELTRITRPKYLPHGLPSCFIAIHIRMGDFPEKSSNNPQIYFKLPIEWYIGSLNTLRSSLGINIPAVIFSDGTTEELKPILEIDNVLRSPFKESITDLLAISKSNVLITSRSSYSLFGAFLGQVPTIWYEGKSDICGSSYIHESPGHRLDIEWMPGNIYPEVFISELKNRINLDKKD